MRVFALIPAAGKSERMGRPKLTLPLGNGTVLERVVAAVRDAGIEEVLVVTRPYAEDIARIGTACGARVVHLPNDTPDMRTTVQFGLRWLEATFAPHADDAFLLLPADHPTLAADVIRGLLHAAADEPNAIWVPSFEGRRGHPTLIPWQHVPALLAIDEGGLNVYLRTCVRRDLPWPSDEVLRDLDTPDDYERLLRLDRIAPNE